MAKKHPARFTPNLDLDTVNGITFLNTEAFTAYMAQNEPEEIKPIMFAADKMFTFKPFEAEQCLSDRKNILRMITDLD